MLPVDLVDRLPNPHLRGYLEPSKKLEAELAALEAKGRRTILASEYPPLLRAAHLRAARLPDDYDSLDAAGRQKARLAVLLGWFDADKPEELVRTFRNDAGELCWDTPALIAAFYLWVEEYIKPAKHNRGMYYNRDPWHKYAMVEVAFSPPLETVGDEPAKSLQTAPRYSTKTDTFIHQLSPMMAITRPHTRVLISEINATRTKEEMCKVRAEVEENELIHRDFGEAGQLWPTGNSGPKKWNSSEMDFVHHPGSWIRGVSFYSPHRGRHPNLWIFDDVEDRKTIHNTEHRRGFLDNFFRGKMGQFKYNDVLIGLSTLIPGSVFHMGMSSRKLSDDDELASEYRNIRFDDWRRVNHDLLTEEDGQVRSIYPDHLSVAGFEAKKRTLGVSEAMAEFRGLAVAAGALALERREFKHEYMHCDGPDGEYALDLRTGIKTAWDKFLAGLFIVTTVDLNDSLDTDSDLGAVITQGIDQDGIDYVLDCWIGRALTDDLIKRGYIVAACWRARVYGVEAAGPTQNTILRLAQRYGEELRQQHKAVPTCVPIEHSNVNKTLRIIGGLRPLYQQDEIRFPRFDTAHLADGSVHEPMNSPHQLYFQVLFDQLDAYTDEGPSGHDDGPDCLEMGVRLLAGQRGEIASQQHPNELVAHLFEELGWTIDPLNLPPQVWTPRMRRELAEAREAMVVGAGTEQEIDPYGF